MAAAGLCLAAAACSKDDITPEPAPQQGITPTKIIFNVTRGGYEGDAETRAPKSEWAEGDDGPRATWSISVRMFI